MQKKNSLYRWLVVAGTVLLWLLILLPLLEGLVPLSRGGGYRVDYLMPAELFPVYLVGAALLLWVAWRTRKRLGWILWSVGAGALFFIGTNVLAVVTGLASGAAEAQGWRLGLVLGAMGVYVLMIIIAAIGGIMLWRDLSRPFVLKRKATQ